MEKIKHWTDIKNRLIGRSGKGYLTLRLLIEDIVIIQCKMTEAQQLYESDKTKILINHNATARGIEEFGYKTYMTILQNKLDEAEYNLNKFKTIAEQIPEFGGEINCILDYIIHGTKWVCTEIITHTIDKRMDRENCIAYVKEAEKLTHRKFRY